MIAEDFYLPKKYYKELYRLMTDVNNIFVKNDIQYWGVSGTTIGALRHKGIITWDDDIDISIWHKDWLKVLTNDIVNQFEKIGCIVVKEKGLNLIKIFYKNAKYNKKNYKLPFIDVFSVSLDRQDKNKVVYTHKWAREGWPKDYQYLDELYPLRSVKFGSQSILIPNKSEKYLNRMFGKNWSKEGRIYQSHLMSVGIGAGLDSDIIVKGPFTPAKNFDSKKVVKFEKNDIENPPYWILKKLQ